MAMYDLITRNGVLLGRRPYLITSDGAFARAQEESK